MTDRELMQQALEALEYLQGIVDTERGPKASAALRERLAREDEPACPYIRSSKEGTHWCALAEQPAIVTRAEEAFAAAKERGWVGLSNEEIELIDTLKAPPVHPDYVDCDDWLDFARAIEAKLREKNG